MTKSIVVRWFGDLIKHDAPAEGPPPDRLGAFMKWCLRGTFGVIGIGAFAQVLVGLSEVAVMVLLGVITDAALTASSLSQEFWRSQWPVIAFWFGLVLLIRPLSFGFASALQSVAVAPNVTKLVLSRLHRHTIGQAVSFFDNDFAGRIAQKQMQTARAVVEIVIESMNALSNAMASVIGATLVVGTISPVLAGVMILWLAIYAAFLRFMLPRNRKLAAVRAGARSMVSGQIVDTITNINTVKLFASSRHEDQAAINALSNYRDHGMKWGANAAAFRLGLTAIAGLLPAALVSITFYLVTAGGASLGELATAGAISIRLAQMTGWVSWTLMTMYSNIGEVEDGIRTLAVRHEIEDAPNAVQMSGPPVVSFENVTFAYGQEVGGIKDLSLTLHEGEKIGIVGASGAGKSTLVSLMLRLYETERGTVRVAGHNVQDVSQESLRAQIGMVTQETAMFNRSAHDNIAYGKPNASEAEVIAAAKRAHAHEFIAEMQDFKGRSGYDAFLGERGVKLSGGQRQRIALARAILKDAPVLVLDEATSALDSEVEADIQDALNDVMEGKTVIAIAHRLSTIAQMDRIVVMEAGQIVEEGTHAQLLARGGRYSSFWEHQSGGFLSADAAE